MPLTADQNATIEKTIQDNIRAKLNHYNPETKQMPFHYRLLGRDRMALFSFIHSLNTTFMTSIFEPVAAQLAKTRFSDVQTHAFIGKTISVAAQMEIQKIMDELTNEGNPNKALEIERMRKVCQTQPMTTTRTIRVDLYLQNGNGVLYLFDLKTVKPNIGDFKTFKRTLLEWIAIVLAQKPETEVHSFIAIPYNPYEPRPCERWTLRGMLDLDDELRVGEEFWDFLGGKGAYQDLMDCFQNAGIALRPELDAFFERFNHL